MHLSNFFINVPLKRYKIALTTFGGEKLDEYHRYFLFDLTQILLWKKFVKEVVFESSV
jgi:hypothetical protein